MPKNEPNNGGDNNEPVSAYAKYSSLGFQMIVIIGGFTYAGYKIDQAAKHNVNWATAVLALIGVFLSLYLVIRSVKN